VFVDLEHEGCERAGIREEATARQKGKEPGALVRCH
jgi:hypothetical protein